MGLFTLFMLFGNFSRLLPVSVFPSSLSLLEGMLYVLAFPAYVFHLRKSQLFCMGVFLSSVYGALLNGFDWVSSLYAFKLVGMIGAAVVLGETFDSERELAHFFLRIFGAVAFFGLILFVCFPQAETFFLLLKGYGIGFHGDPHLRRFISPFFDPNYYAAIACFPLILAYQQRRFALFSFLLFTVVLTFSRSGIATCGLLLMIAILRSRGRLSWKGWLFVAVCIMPLFFPSEMTYLWNRSLHFLEDPSATARFETFELALSFFLSHPFFGAGYNYLSQLFEEAFGRLAPDSSLLVILINFGLIPFLAMLFGALWWLVNHVRRDISLVYIYTVICILFTSLFNNLLLYPYWLIPVGAFLASEGGGLDESSTCSRLADPNGRSRKGARGSDRAL